MIAEWLLAADLVDAVANPYRTIEEHEAGSARLATLATHGARIDEISFEDATDVDVHLLSAHIWRWALDAAKRSYPGESRTRLPDAELFEGLYAADTDRLNRLLMVDSILTHPDVEARFREFDEQGQAVSLEQLPNVWPRDHLIRLTRETEGEAAMHRTDANLLELCMILLQIATPAALALLGGTIKTLQAQGRGSHPLVETVQAFVAEVDDDLAMRLGVR